jgi:hypothetical protein
MRGLETRRTKANKLGQGNPTDDELLSRPSSHACAALSHVNEEVGRRESPESFAFRDGQRCGDVIEISGQTGTERDDGCPVTALRPRLHLDLFEAFAEALEESGYVTLDCQRNAHTSRHKPVDVRMSNGVLSGERDHILSAIMIRFRGIPFG